jgi:hypothetical protein
MLRFRNIPVFWQYGRGVPGDNRTQAGVSDTKRMYREINCLAGFLYFLITFSARHPQLEKALMKL